MAISAPERHHLPNSKQASLLMKISWDSGWLTSAGRVTARDQLPRRDTAAAAAAKSLQPCLTLCDPIVTLWGSSVSGILQARILEWVAIPFSRGSSQPNLLHCRWILYLPYEPPEMPLILISVQSFSLVRLFATPWTAARQASLSITNSQTSLKIGRAHV